MPTYTPLQSIELTAATASVTFSGIPQIYQDLVLVVTAQQSADAPIYLRVNGSSASIYSTTSLRGSGSAATSTRFSASGSGIDGEGMWVQSEAFPESTSYGTITYNLLNYSNTNTFKNALIRFNNASSFVGLNVSLAQTTSAITSLTLRHGGGGANFAIGSTFDLYGISPVAATNAQAAGGTDIFYDSSYVYHVFKGSGTFTPYRNLTCDYLVVAGGGSGGSGGSGATNGGGGGGAGGVRSTVTWTGGRAQGSSLESALSLTANTNYTVTIGAGGAGAASVRTNGSNSVFSTITSTGGGAGGNRAATEFTGNSGGSGGGGGTQTGASANTQSGGTGTTGQGFAGGSGSTNNSNAVAGGGGGGAQAAGSNGSYSASVGTGGAGGSGIWTALTNAVGIGELSSSNYYIAGGGGGMAYAGAGGTATGGAAGLGGGGTGYGNTGANAAPTAGSGTTNTGGGGGSSGAGGGNGGSGIVIVRYAR